MDTARAYFLDGAYDQAEAALDELIPSIDSVPGDQVSPFILAFFGSIEQPQLRDLLSIRTSDGSDWPS
jgi:hypothetical protein